MAKPVRWMGSSRKELAAFPDDARREAGFQLRMVQTGQAPHDWKPMQSVGPGVMEIRVHRGGEFRVLYVARYREAVYVLHCFRKRTKRTSQADLATARRRYDEVIAARGAEEG